MYIHSRVLNLSSEFSLVFFFDLGFGSKTYDYWWTCLCKNRISNFSATSSELVQSALKKKKRENSILNEMQTKNFTFSV